MFVLLVDAFCRDPEASHTPSAPHFRSEFYVAQIDTPADDLAITCLQRAFALHIRAERKPVCEWKGITCRDGIVWKMFYRTLHPNMASLDWLPPTLRKARVEFSRREKVLNTRRLPRMLTVFRVKFSDVHGEVDLRTLPEHLEFFSLQYNKVCGTVYLDQLPANIRVIDLYWNPITACVVVGRCLPESLTDVYVCGPKAKVKVQYVDSSRDSRRALIRKTLPRALLFEEAFDGW